MQKQEYYSGQPLDQRLVLDDQLAGGQLAMPWISLPCMGHWVDSHPGRESTRGARMRKFRRWTTKRKREKHSSASPKMRSCLPGHALRRRRSTQDTTASKSFKTWQLAEEHRLALERQAEEHHREHTPTAARNSHRTMIACSKRQGSSRSGTPQLSMRLRRMQVPIGCLCDTCGARTHPSRRDGR